MEKYNFQAYIVPLDDQGRREWISGFTGSNGDCVITKDKVIYFISMYSAVQNKHLFLFAHNGSLIGNTILFKET